MPVFFDFIFILNKILKLQESETINILNLHKYYTSSRNNINNNFYMNKC